MCILNIVREETFDAEWRYDDVLTSFCVNVFVTDESLEGTSCKCARQMCNRMYQSISATRSTVYTAVQYTHAHTVCLCVCVWVCFGSRVSFEAVWLLPLSPAPVPSYGYSVQADIQLAVARVATSPFTPSPASQGVSANEWQVGRTGGWVNPRSRRPLTNTNRRTPSQTLLSLPTGRLNPVWNCGWLKS